MKAGFNRRRSSCSEDNWARFRVLYSQEQLDRLSFVFGECEESDKLENFIKVNDRYAISTIHCLRDKNSQSIVSDIKLLLGERLFGADLVREMTRAESPHHLRTPRPQRMSSGCWVEGIAL